MDKLVLKKLANNCHALHMNDSKVIYGFSYELNIGLYISNTDELYINKEALGYSHSTQRHLYLFISTYSGNEIHSQREFNNLVKIGKIKLMDLTA